MYFLTNPHRGLEQHFGCLTNLLDCKKKDRHCNALYIKVIDYMSLGLLLIQLEGPVDWGAQLAKVSSLLLSDHSRVTSLQLRENVNLAQ